MNINIANVSQPPAAVPQLCVSRAIAMAETNVSPTTSHRRPIGRIILATIAGIILALVMIYFFPLTPAKMAEIRTQLEARRGKV